LVCFRSSVCVYLMLCVAGNRKGSKQQDVDVTTDGSEPGQLITVTVELSVELEKWQSASEARLLTRPS